MQICPYHFSRISWNLHFNFFNSSEYWGAYYSVEICDDCFKSKINQGLYLSLNWHSEIKLAIKDNFFLFTTNYSVRFVFNHAWHRCVMTEGVVQRISQTEFPRTDHMRQFWNFPYHASIAKMFVLTHFGMDTWLY